MTRKAIFITGAAGGIGRASAVLFHAKGWFVGLYDVAADPCHGMAETFGRDNARAGSLDITDPMAWRSALADFWAHSGQRLDVLFNNAGVLASGPFEAIPLERQHQMVDINLKGLLTGCHTAYAYLADTPGARIINMASASAIYGQPDVATYSATKFAVRGLTEALDIEWQPRGIRVMAIWPLFVRTAMIEDLAGAASVKTLGVRLGPADVAATVYRAAQSSGRKRHWPIGGLTRAMFYGVGLGPGALTRWLVRRIARR